MQKRFFPFFYYQNARALGTRRFETQIHKVRDGLAVTELSAALNDVGYTYGGAILNIPQTHREKLAQQSKLVEHEYSFEPHDVLLHPTRPPLDEESKRIVDWSGSPLENQLLTEVQQFFDHCDRGVITISDQMIADSEPADVSQDFRHLDFQQFQGGAIKNLNALHGPRPPNDSNYTVGYLLVVPRIPTCEVRFIACFGAGGSETAYFSYALRTIYPNYLNLALSINEPVLWQIPFLVPDYCPELLQCDPADLQPTKDKSNPIKWTFR